MLSQAVLQAYGDLLFERQLPFVLLHIGIDPSRIDVNVHPAKLEVRFDDERSVRNMFYPVVKRAIRLYDLSPDLAPAPVDTAFSAGVHDPAFRKLTFQDMPGRIATTGDLYAGYRDSAIDMPSFGPAPPVRQNSLFQSGTYAGTGQREVREGDERMATIQSDPLPEEESSHIRKEPETKIWQLHNRYIFCQIKTGMMIIDQHVAHERVLYERACDIMEENVPNSQQLLFPQKVELRPWEYDVFEEIKDELFRLGFNLRLFGQRTVMVEGVPQDVRPGTEVTILQDMIAEYQSNAAKLKLEKRDNIAKSYSCRNAIMAGQKLSLEEMRSLIDNLFATREPYCCPHGRPVIVKFSLDQLDRMFGRK